MNREFNQEKTVNSNKSNRESKTLPTEMVAKIVSYTDGIMPKINPLKKEVSNSDASYLPSRKILPELEKTLKFKEKFQKKEVEKRKTLKEKEISEPKIKVEKKKAE